MVGTRARTPTEIKRLNRIVGWDHTKGIVSEARPSRAGITFQQLRVDGAKAVSILGTKDDGRTPEDCEEELDEQQAFQYISITAMCNHISPDRPDIAYAVKALARHI